ncbi:MAG: macro domain-containing protein [Pseudomonadota bacterium]
MRFAWETFTSLAYWRYVLFSTQGITSVLAYFGGIYLVVEALDFFDVYSRDKYASAAFFVFLALGVLLSIIARRPIKTTTISFPNRDYAIEVRIGDLFDAAGAVMISSNTEFESDVAGGKIAPSSLQGQFTGRYFTGNQQELIDEIDAILNDRGGDPPYPLGTVVPVTTHGKTFYFLAMAELNEHGNASATERGVSDALDGLWKFIHQQGELQEIAVPIIGTGRGRLQMPKRKMIEEIASSFVNASKDGKISDRLVIVLRKEDAIGSEYNLWDIKDHLKRSLVT